jgi:6-phosphogluconolactonase
MPLHIYPESKELSKSCAEWICSCIAETLEKKDLFTLVLSGGNTPRPLYELLARPPYREKIQWGKLHLFWGDERAVPFEDPRNNAKMAFDSLLDQVQVPASQIHVMRTDISPEQSAEEYERLLHLYFPDLRSPEETLSDIRLDPGRDRHTMKSFDLVLLGMGDDGHTLSLFPGTPMVYEKTSWVKSYFLQSQDMYRITLTQSIVNKSDRIAFLVTGPDKANALKEVLEGNFDPSHYPSQVIRPESGALHWFIDETAAAKLSSR